MSVEKSKRLADITVSEMLAAINLLLGQGGADPTEDWANDWDYLPEEAWLDNFVPVEKIPITALTDEEYFSRPELNWSTLKRFLADPRWYLTHPASPPATGSQELGTMVHCAILQPELFGKIYAQFQPPVNPKTGEPFKSGKDYDLARAEFEASGKKAITSLQQMQIREIVDSLKEHDLTKYFHHVTGFRDFLHTEERILLDEKNQCKCKIDCYHEYYGIIDIKTTSSLLVGDSGYDLFEFEAKKYRYLDQLSFYAFVFESLFGVIPPCGIVAVETATPYRSAYYPIDLDYIKRTIDKIRNSWIPEFRKSVESGVPSYLFGGRKLGVNHG